MSVQIHENGEWEVHPPTSEELRQLRRQHSALDPATEAGAAELTRLWCAMGLIEIANRVGGLEKQDHEQKGTPRVRRAR